MSIAVINQGAISVINITGATIAANASRDLSVSDINSTLINNNASSTTFTIQNDATSGWQDGSFISIYQSGAGTPAFAAGSGVTLRNPNSVVAVRYGFIAAQRVGVNEWAIL